MASHERGATGGILGIFCVGDGPFTMGPQAGEEFHQAVSALAPGVAVSVMKPGDSKQIRA